jgi:hypothetical protein
MVEGEKEQLNALEIPLQESAIGLVKVPDCVCAITVNFPDCPGAIVTDPGEALNDNVGGGGGGGCVTASHDAL